LSRLVQSVGLSRGEAVICVLVAAGQAPSKLTLKSIAEQTPDHVTVVICDTTTSAAGAIAAAAPADVVLIRSGCVVGPGWLGALAAAAHSDATVATASALRLGDVTLLGSVPTAKAFSERAARVSGGSLQLRPRLEASAGPCVYVRRTALELVAEPTVCDPVGAAASLRFSRACLDAGLSHVLADDVLIDDPDPRPSVGERGGPVARALGVARRSLQGLTVVVDARILSGPRNGTRVHVLELIAALARTGRARVTAIVPPNIDETTGRLLARLPSLTLVTLSATDGGPLPRADVVHRPFQISSPAELRTLASIGERIVISHQDLISYHNPDYFASDSAWRGYRDMTRRALALADGVVFLTAHARDQAIAEELVERHRACVVPLGVDHTVTGHDAVPERPGGVEKLEPEVEMMLCLGSDFRHKNRLFALRVLRELQHRHSWPGRLVLAGPRVRFGSSRGDERAMLERDRRLADAVVELGAVTDAEKHWLLSRAGLVLYPTVHEGFGLIPFEAADHDVPCLWAEGTSLSEVLPRAAAGIIAWDAEAAARRGLELLRDELARRELVGRVREAAASLRWEAAAERLIDHYEAVCSQPAASAAVLERTTGLMRPEISEDAIRLVGPDGALPKDLERPLLALATHPRFGTPVLGAIKSGYRAYRRLRPTERSGPG
jgi:glycosyltransferase involved in cell wall biosynthesis